MFVEHVFWPSEGQSVMLSPLGVHVCERVHEHYLYVCMWHTSALQVTTQQQTWSQMRTYSKYRRKANKSTRISVWQSLTVSHTPSAEEETRGNFEGGYVVFKPPCLNSSFFLNWLNIFRDHFKHIFKYTVKSWSLLQHVFFSYMFIVASHCVYVCTCFHATSRHFRLSMRTLLTPASLWPCRATAVQLNLNLSVLLLNVPPRVWIMQKSYRVKERCLCEFYPIMHFCVF